MALVSLHDHKSHSYLGNGHSHWHYPSVQLHIGDIDLIEPLLPVEARPRHLAVCTPRPGRHLLGDQDRERSGHRREGGPRGVGKGLEIHFRFRDHRKLLKTKS